MQRRPDWMNRSTLAIGFSILASALLIAMSCDFSSDQFACGVLRDDGTSDALLCNRPGERCVCAYHRCAVPDGVCSSGLRYSFGDQVCVDDKDAKTSLTQLVGGDTFCPGDVPTTPCGRPGGKACGGNAACVCDTHRCAERDEACPSGFRYAGSTACIDSLDARPEGLLYSTMDAGTLCPDQSPLPPPCGITIFGQPTPLCSVGSRCVCADNHFRCAALSSACASAYVWSDDGTCIKDLDASAIEAPQNQVDKSGLCPAYAAKDAGADADADAP